MNVALLLMAGSGTRTASKTPKQFIEINHKPLFMYSLLTFLNNKQIKKVLIVTNKDKIALVNDYLKKFNIKKKKIAGVIEGGDTRYKSVIKGLDYLISKVARPMDNVLIHDAARPNISDEIIKHNIAALTVRPTVLTCLEADPAILNQPRVDTIHVRGEKVYRAQTPQSFKLSLIHDLYHKVIDIKPFPFTDDAAIATAYSYDVVFVEGEESNYKVTTKADLDRFANEQKQINEKI